MTEPIVPCERCDKPAKPACALVAGHWYCLAHTRDLAQEALIARDEALAWCEYNAKLVTLLQRELVKHTGPVDLNAVLREL